MEQFVTVVVERNPSISNIATWKWNLSQYFFFFELAGLWYLFKKEPNVGELFEGTTSEIADGIYWLNIFSQLWKLTVISRFLQTRVRNTVFNSVAWLNGLKTEAVITKENLCYFRSARLHNLKGFLYFITFIARI